MSNQDILTSSIPVLLVDINSVKDLRKQILHRKVYLAVELDGEPELVRISQGEMFRLFRFNRDDPDRSPLSWQAEVLLGGVVIIKAGSV